MSGMPQNCTCRLGHVLRVMPVTLNCVIIYCPCHCGRHRGHWGLHRNPQLYQLAAHPSRHCQYLPNDHFTLPRRDALILGHGYFHSHDRDIDLGHEEYIDFMESGYGEEEIDR